MRRWIERWRREQEPGADALYREAEQRFVELANTLRDRLAAVPGLEALSRLETHRGLHATSRYYHADLMQVAPVSTVTWILDAVLPWGRPRMIELVAGDYLERLLQVNSARMKNDFDERVLESRRLLEGEIRDRLRRLAASAERALQDARLTHSSGKTAVRERLEWLDDLRARIDTLRPAGGGPTT